VDRQQRLWKKLERSRIDLVAYKNKLNMLNKVSRAFMRVNVQRSILKQGLGSRPALRQARMLHSISISHFSTDKQKVEKESQHVENEEKVTKHTEETEKDQ
jgi:hypothetical protein